MAIQSSLVSQRFSEDRECLLHGIVISIRKSLKLLYQFWPKSQWTLSSTALEEDKTILWLNSKYYNNSLELHNTINKKILTNFGPLFTLDTRTHIVSESYHAKAITHMGGWLLTSFLDIPVITIWYVFLYKHYYNDYRNISKKNIIIISKGYIAINKNRRLMLLIINCFKLIIKFEFTS